jgi:hypothetical protein
LTKLSNIRLELARDQEFPEGSRSRGYQLIAPLDPLGRLDQVAWKKMRDKCRVKRFWAGQPDEIGHFIHKRGGVWAFDYDPKSEADDEAGFKLDKHIFKPGEYISFQERDGVMRAFRIVSVVEMD